MCCGNYIMSIEKTVSCGNLGTILSHVTPGFNHGQLLLVIEKLVKGEGQAAAGWSICDVLKAG